MKHLNPYPKNATPEEAKAWRDAMFAERDRLKEVFKDSNAAKHLAAIDAAVLALSDALGEDVDCTLASDILCRAALVAYGQGGCTRAYTEACTIQSKDDK